MKISLGSKFYFEGGSILEAIVPDQIIMGLILHSGNAKQHMYEALKRSKKRDFEESAKEILLAEEALTEAHNMQTSFLAEEAKGNKTEITALFVHAQDHLMTTITEIALIKEIIELREESINEIN